MSSGAPRQRRRLVVVAPRRPRRGRRPRAPRARVRASQEVRGRDGGARRRSLRTGHGQARTARCGDSGTSCAWSSCRGITVSELAKELGVDTSGSLPACALPRPADAAAAVPRCNGAPLSERLRAPVMPTDGPREPKARPSTAGATAAGRLATTTALRVTAVAATSVIVARDKRLARIVHHAG
jgi:hypothetical protein